MNRITSHRAGSLLLVCGLLFLTACNYTGRPDNAVERRYTWFSYLAGDDLRESCRSHAPPRYRDEYPTNTRSDPEPEYGRQDLEHSRPASGAAMPDPGLRTRIDYRVIMPRTTALPPTVHCHLYVLTAYMCWFGSHCRIPWTTYMCWFWGGAAAPNVNLYVLVLWDWESLRADLPRFAREARNFLQKSVISLIATYMC